MKVYLLRGVGGKAHPPNVFINVVIATASYLQITISTLGIWTAVILSACKLNTRTNAVLRGIINKTLLFSTPSTVSMAFRVVTLPTNISSSSSSPLTTSKHQSSSKHHSSTRKLHYILVRWTNRWAALLYCHNHYLWHFLSNILSSGLMQYLKFDSRLLARMFVWQLVCPTTWLFTIVNCSSNEESILALAVNSNGRKFNIRT